MATADAAWQMQVDRGPDWLFVKLTQPQRQASKSADLDESLWVLLRKHFTKRLVLEMDQVEAIPKELISQLASLDKRLKETGGMLRICGLNDTCEESLRASDPAKTLPNFRDRTEAVLGPRPKPR